MDRRTFITATGGAVTAGALAGCIGLGGSGGDTITIGSDIPYRPFEYKKEDGTLVGFDVDIAKAVFEEQMDQQYEFKETGFDGIIGSLNNGNFRVIMSAMTINDRRAEKVDFSDPYFTAYQTIIALKGSNIQSKTDLKGKNVGVQKGTTGEGAADDLKSQLDGDLSIKRYDQITGAFDALMNNQVTAVVNDNTVNGEFASQHDNVVFVQGDGEAAAQGENAPPYLTLTVENYGIAFRKDDDDFRTQVDEALAAIKDSGRYDEIYNSYFQG